MRNQIKVALMGAERIGQERAKNLASFPNVKVVVVCDPIIAAAERVKPLTSVGSVTDLAKEALGWPETEAAVIGTPTDIYVDLLEVAACAKKAIFCEMRRAPGGIGRCYLNRE